MKFVNETDAIEKKIDEGNLERLILVLMQLVRQENNFLEHVVTRHIEQSISARHQYLSTTTEQSFDYSTAWQC